jgi:hypothetical protein
MPPGHRWFDRGMFEMRIEVEMAIGPKGREIRTIRYKSDYPESGSIPGPRPNTPHRFRHLLTPEMLEMLDLPGAL